MKICYVFLLCCLFVTASLSVSFGEGTLHTFTTPDGRSLNAVIKDHNERTGKIQIEREDENLIWILPTVFSEPDQEYIQQWIAADQFMSPTKFKIKGDSEEDETSKNKTEIVYTITLENKTDFPLKDLKIEYRAFIFNKGYEDKADSNWIGGDQLHITEIPAGKRVSQKLPPITLVTQFVTVREHSGNSWSEYEKKTESEQLEGFWVKIYGPTLDEKPTIREWYTPSDTSKSFVWPDTISRRPVIRSPLATTKFHDYSDKELELLNEARRLQESTPDKALTLYKEAYEIGQSPWAEAGIGELHIYHLKPINIPLGLEWLEKAAARNDYRGYHLLVKFYSTYEDPQYHDIKRAIIYSLQLILINPSFGDHSKLADLYAQDGQFKKAVEHQKLAIEIYEKFCEEQSKKPLLLLKMETTLKHYQKKQNRITRHRVLNPSAQTGGRRSVEALKVGTDRRAVRTLGRHAGSTLRTRGSPGGRALPLLGHRY